MATPDANPTTLELTEVETRLRQLLLDVAAFIDETAGPGPVESAVKVPEDLTKEKIVLRFTGGWVRDKLLGVGSHDIDVAINKMTGEHFGLKLIEFLSIPENAAKWKEVAPNLHKIGANPEKSKHLETATTNFMGIDLDLVNLRKETYNEVSRNPVVEFGTPEEDAMRRDATINAMFYNLNTSKIEDFTGRGFKDMQAKIIRTPLEPYQTFKDDPLRVLRLIRFASRLGYTIDSETEKAMSNKEIGEVLKIKISRERVGIEFEKMLKGPDPLMALSLIDRLGLYNTIFTDPTRDLSAAPDVSYFSSAYKFVDFLSSSAASEIPIVIPETLVRNPEEKYLAWICAALMPWVDAPTVPHQKPLQRPYYAAYLVAREGFKAPNKICDVVAASMQNGDEIRQLVDRCYDELKRPNASKSGNETATRDVLGMAIRRWGASWRTQVLFSLLYEIVLGSISRERILDSYATFLTRLTHFSILEAHTFKPLITGTQLAKALNTKPGPWMKDALDVVMSWQLRNPDSTDPGAAIEAVKAGLKSSELSSALASHFLQLTIRPLFSQAKTEYSTLTPAGHAAPIQDQRIGSFEEKKEVWKEGKNSYAIDLLSWSLSTMDASAIEKNWALLIPPILKITDDTSLHWKTRGCALLTLLLQSTSPSLLARTGLGPVFEDSLFPLFTYLPTLTPEDDACKLLDAAFPAVVALGNVLYPQSEKQHKQEDSSSLSTPRERYLDKLLRDCILAPLFHAPPALYPKLATTLLAHLPALLNAMGVDSVKHLQPLVALLSGILAEPLGMAEPRLMGVAAKGLQGVILNAWPRVARYRAEIVRGCCFAWVRSCEEGGGEGVEGVRRELKEVVGMLDAVLRADKDDGIRDGWEGEVRDLIGADERLVGLFEGVGGGE